MTKYSLVKRIVMAVPGMRKGGAGLFMAMPDAISPFVYKLMRRLVFRDNENRVPVFRAAFAEVAKQPASGHYIEFGVARGTSVITAMGLAREFGPKFDAMHVYACDSFEGLPEDEKHFQKGDYSYGEEVFARFTKKAGVPQERITRIPGFYDRERTHASLVEGGVKPGVHIVHMDCDIYVSTKEALAIVAPLLEVGSVIIFDDWFSFRDEDDPWQHGEKRAFEEWELRDMFQPLAISYNWNASFIRVR